MKTHLNRKAVYIFSKLRNPIRSIFFTNKAQQTIFVFGVCR